MLKSPDRIIIAVMLLHLYLMRTMLPLWLSVCANVFVLLALFAHRIPERMRWKKWSFRFELILEVLGGVFAAIIYSTIRPAVGIESSSALIAILLALQMFLLHTRRAQWRLIFLWIFSLALIMIEHSGLGITLFAIFDLVCIFYWMSRFEDASARFSFSGFRTALVFVLLSLPVWMAIFLFFPRFTIELWGNASNTADIGFGETLEPGQIERLIANNSIALRVRYPDGPPPGIFQYYRGGVMEQGEGLSWRIGTSKNPTPPGVTQNRSQSIEQEIWASAVHGRILVALDRPSSVQVSRMQVEASDQDVFRLRQTPIRRENYLAWSMLGPAQRSLTEADFTRLTYLSENFRTELDQWALRQGFTPRKQSALEAVAAIRAFIVEQKFRYSMEPPALASGGLIEFMEKSRIGFCEHFAGTAATLLRYQGVPARIVSGYLGGRKDPYSEDFIIMSREAHAWVEFYDDATLSWNRLDPTLWVEPLRLQFGSELNWLSEDMRSQLATRGQELLPWWPRLKEQMLIAWDSSVGRAERFVLSYEASWIQDTGEAIGIPEYSDSLAFVFLMIVIALLVTLLPRLRHLWRPKDPWLRIWQKFGRHMGARFQFSHGEKSQWENWLRQNPLSEEKSKKGHTFVNFYLEARYGGKHSLSEVKKHLNELS